MLKAIPFAKLTGSGNDFILIDNMAEGLPTKEIEKMVPKLCARALSVGADGLIILVPSKDAHFRWRFFNSDGSEAEMCGNGGRCAARFAYERGIAPQKLTFATLAGILEAEVKENGVVKLQLTPPKGLKLEQSLTLGGGEAVAYGFVDTGVPHVVVWEEDLENTDVEGLGREIRFHSNFAPAGTNVNFAKVTGENAISIRTYERGVESETLACGTGSTAAAYIGVKMGLVKPPVRVTTRSGEELLISLEGERLFLEGGTRWVYDGVMHTEAWEW